MTQHTKYSGPVNGHFLGNIEVDFAGVTLVAEAFSEVDPQSKGWFSSMNAGDIFIGNVEVDGKWVSADEFKDCYVESWAAQAAKEFC